MTGSPGPTSTVPAPWADVELDELAGDVDESSWRPALARITRGEVRERANCRACGADRGEWCRGRRGPRASNHADRIADALDYAGRPLR